MAKQAAVSKKTTKNTSKKAAPKTAAAKKITKTVAAKVTTAPTKAPAKGFSARFNRDLTPQALVAEVFGTFIIAIVALTATAVLAPLYVGLTVLVLVVAIGAISGAHVNPAVTFGLWTARKFPGFAVPFYILAQLIGALAAVVALGALGGNGVSLSLASFFSFDVGVFVVEVIGGAIFLFGVMAAISRDGLNVVGKAAGVGFSLLVALVVAGGLYTSLGNSVDRSQISTVADVPRLLRLDGALINPAIALGAKEKTNAELQGTANDGTESPASRLTLGETIVGTLLGAAAGANLYRLLARREAK